MATLLLVIGCDRSDNRAGPATAPATPVELNPGTSPPATAPASTAPSLSFIWVDQQPYQFPPARIILKTTKDQRVAALLFSDDPPSAIDDNYAGNSYYLEMVPEIPATSGTLVGAVWDFKAPNSERVDSVSGIYLHGRRRHLQPFDVHVEFDASSRSGTGGGAGTGGGSSPVTVLMSGTFLMFDSEADDQQPGQLVAVRAELLADVRAKSQGK